MKQDRCCGKETLHKHRCDGHCICPNTGKPYYYWPAGDEHACQYPDCRCLSDWPNGVVEFSQVLYAIMKAHDYEVVEYDRYGVGMRDLRASTNVWFRKNPSWMNGV